MLVLRTKSRARLESLRDRLDALEPMLPSGLETVLARHRALAADVASKLATWRPRLGGEGGLTSLETAVDSLEALTRSLAAPVARAAGLREELNDLRGRVQPLGGDVVLWIEAQCRDWEARLANIGASTLRTEDVVEEERRLDAIEGELRRHFEALYWFGALQSALAGFRERTPREADDLVLGLGKRLIDEGVHDAWLQQARAAQRRLSTLQDEEARRPPELSSVARLLPVLRGWSEALGTGASDVQDLDRRFRGVVVADWTTLPPRLEQEAKDLESRFRGQAEEKRHGALDDLRRRMAELTEHCGHQPELAATIAALAERSVARPQVHTRWMREHARAEERLRAIASSHQGQLEHLLSERLADLERAVVDVRSQPLSEAVLVRVREIEETLTDFVRPAEVEGLVSWLCRVAELAQTLEVLRVRAASDLESERARQKELDRERVALRDAMTALDPEGVFDGVDDPPAESGAVDSPLERMREASDAIAQDLVDLRQRFDRCSQRRHDACLAAFDDLASAMARLDAEVTLDPPPPLPVDAAPADVVDAVHAAENALEGLEQRAEAIEATLPARRERLAERLAALSTETLDPADRERVKRLGKSLDAPREDLGLSARLRAQGRMFARGEALVTRHEATLRTMAMRWRALATRLDDCRDRGLDSFHARGWQRAVALVYGLPDPPTGSHDDREQLDAAERLVERLELTSSKCIANVFRADVARLRRQSGGPETRALIADVEALDEAAVPPVDLRYRLERFMVDRTRLGNR